jgi:hypothetical protein
MWNVLLLKHATSNVFFMLPLSSLTQAHSCQSRTQYGLSYFQWYITRSLMLQICCIFLEDYPFVLAFKHQISDPVVAINYDFPNVSTKSLL